MVFLPPKNGWFSASASAPADTVPRVAATYDPPVKQCETTFQLPVGPHSAMDALAIGELSPAAALLSVVLQYRSNWASGKTWRSSLRTLAQLTGMSVRYLRDKLADLKTGDWVETLSTGMHVGSRYQMTHHTCPDDAKPTDRDGRPLKCAIPRGTGGILERLFAGDISWKSALIWIALKVHSNWKTGVTRPLTISELRQRVGMSPQTVIDCLAELTEAGLLVRLNGANTAGVYQLYPTPNDLPKGRYETRYESVSSGMQLRVDGDWRISANELWRVNIMTGEVERRKYRRRGKWKSRSLGDAIPKAIERDFDEVIEVHRVIRNAPFSVG